MHIYQLLFYAAAASAKLHHFFVGTFTEGHLYGIEFDEAALTLKVIMNLTVAEPHLWLELDHRKKNLYTGSGTNWTSYTIHNTSHVSLSSTIPIGAPCTADAHYTLASRHPPYNVYGTPWSIPGASLVSDCGDVISVDHTGALSRVTQTFRYANGSAIHGHAIDKGQEYLYSADLRGDKIWAHQVYANGYVKEIGAMGTTAGANPRHLATHPGGKYIYAVLEHANELAEYKLDPTTRLPVAESVRTWGLAPEESNSTFWADEVRLSHSGQYLWASTRSRNATETGYISVFSVGSSGKVGERLFLKKSTGTGGAANAVRPSDWDDRWVANTDSALGVVEVWEFDGKTARVVASLGIRDTGCCATAVWYD